MSVAFTADRHHAHLAASHQAQIFKRFAKAFVSYDVCSGFGFRHDDIIHGIFDSGFIGYARYMDYVDGYGGL